MNGSPGLGVDFHMDISRPGVRASIEGALRSAIQRGRLRPGTRLPSSRTLASDFGISRNTVVDAYSQLTEEGWLTARRGSVTRVAKWPPSSSDHNGKLSSERTDELTYDLRPGAPDVAAFPAKEWFSAMRAGLLNTPSAALGYENGQGHPELRETISAYLGRTRAVHATTSSVVICAGTIHAFSLLCTLLKSRGASSIALERYVDPRFARTAVLHGLRAVSVGVDGAGACIDEIESLHVDAILLTPGNQFPTGRVLSVERRAAVVDWADRTGGLIIEDDYDAEFRYDRQPPASLQELAPSCVAYLGTTSKTLVPALRLGWAVLPEQLVPGTANIVRSTVGQVAVLEQIGLAEYIRSGGYDRHVRRRRLSYRHRRDRLLAACDQTTRAIQVNSVAAGLQVVIELQDVSDARLNELALVDRARQRGLHLEGLHRFDSRHASQEYPALVIGFGTPPDELYDGALQRLISVLTDQT